jgi:hypothetical protein
MTDKSRYPSSHEREVLLRFLPNKVHCLPIYDAVNVVLAQECSKPTLRIVKSRFDGLLRYAFSNWLTELLSLIGVYFMGVYLAGCAPRGYVPYGCVDHGACTSWVCTL